MQQRTINELDTQSIIDTPNEKIDVLIALFDNLKRKVNIDLADITDVELLVQKIIDLSTRDSKEQSISIIQSIQGLSKKYTILLPFLIKSYKEAIQDQIKYADHDDLKEQVQNSKAFTQCLRLVLIQPMLLGMAENTQNFFISEYFGKIPIISMCGNDIHTTSKLCNIDSSLKENMDLLKTNTGCLSALQPYALAFNYLNKENEQISTSLNNKTLFNYLIESARHNQSISTDSNLPKLIFASEDVMQMFLSDTRSTHHVYGETLKDEKIILISIDKKNNFDKIIKSIIHEMQHLYNSYLVNEDNQEDYSKYLSDEAISIFIELINSIKDDDLLNGVRDIQNILRAISHYKQQDRDLDELSAHLTYLLSIYTDDHLRLIVEIISAEISNAPELTSKNEALLVCKAINDALFYVENTIKHLSVALRKFKANATKEFLDIHFEKNTDLDEVRLSANEIVEQSLESLSWNEILEQFFNIETATKELVEVISYIDPAYSLHEQAKIGNNKMVKDLLQISKAGINKFDDHHNSPLTYAVMHHHISTFNLLLQFGASPKCISEKDKNRNWTLLHTAAICGNFEIIPILLDCGLSANEIDENKQTPLVLLTQDISISYQGKSITDTSYNQSIKALVYLLSHSNYYKIKPSHDFRNDFYIALLEFRKYLSLLYVMYTNGSLGSAGVPNDIFYNIALQFNYNVPCRAYKDCYRDISVLLFSNKILFNQFITLGMQSAYDDFQIALQNSINPFNAIKKKFFEIIPLDSLLTNTSSTRDPLSQDEIKQLSNYYSPRNLLLGATSLSAVTFAQKELRVKTNKPFFQENKYNERRLTIRKWKSKAADNEDEGLSLALVQVFNEIGIKEIDSKIYHKLSAILNRLVIKENKTPGNYNLQLFKKEFKNIYQESMQDNKQFKVRK